MSYRIQMRHLIERLWNEYGFSMSVEEEEEIIPILQQDYQLGT